MSTLRCLIVDDERLARVELRAVLAEVGNCTVVAEAGNVPDARLALLQYRPELVFLDINMPGKNGFELLAGLPNCPPVIFVTAYDEFALRAFEVNALDYLLKPVTVPRLRTALERVSAKTSPRLFVPNRNGGRFVDLEEVFLLRAYDHYVRLYHPAGSDLLHRALGEMESQLDPELYFRVNRSEIVLLSAVENVENMSRGRYRFILPAGEEVTVSERRAVIWRRTHH